MELNELKNVWKQQEKNDNYEYSESELMMVINNKMISLEEKIKSRDRIEIGAAIIVIGMFTFFGYSSNSVWTQLGSGIIVLSAAFIWFKLKTTQRKSFDEKESYNRPMRECLDQELKSLRQQKQLLENVAWWYLTPIWIGLLFFTLGLNSGLLYKISYMIAVSILYIWIWRKNIQAIKKEYEPLEAELSEAKASIEHD